MRNYHSNLAFTRYANCYLPWTGNQAFDCLFWMPGIPLWLYPLAVSTRSHSAFPASVLELLLRTYRLNLRFDSGLATGGSPNPTLDWENDLAGIKPTFHETNTVCLPSQSYLPKLTPLAVLASRSTACSVPSSNGFFSRKKATLRPENGLKRLTASSIPTRDAKSIILNMNYWRISQSTTEGQKYCSTNSLQSPRLTKNSGIRWSSGEED